MERKNKKCVNCKKLIEKKENYYEVKEFKKGILFESKYSHKNCQNEFNKNLKQTIEFQQALSKEVEKIRGNI